MGASGLQFHDVGKKKVVTSTATAMKIIQEAFALRKTASTGQNEHSSRSHAVVRVELEHRWLPPTSSIPPTVVATAGAAAAASKAKAIWKSRKCKVLFVDLAGEECTRLAHGGGANASGCAIGLGLLALQKVCAAINKGEAHVPYRDSVLTRLLENALSGICRTAVVGCVGGHARRDGERTMNFVRKLASVKTIRARATLNDIDLSENDPLRDDQEDANRDLQRRTVFIETTFGDVFARVVGRPSNPLVLYIHGSGPRNSSLQWNWLVYDVATMQPSQYFHVAIDCPGCTYRTKWRSTKIAEQLETHGKCLPTPPPPTPNLNQTVVPLETSKQSVPIRATYFLASSALWERHRLLL